MGGAFQRIVPGMPRHWPVLALPPLPAPALAEGRQPQFDAAHQLACRRRQRPAQPQQRLAFRRAQDRMRDGSATSSPLATS